MAPAAAPQPVLPSGAAVGPSGPSFYVDADFLLWRIRKPTIPDTASVIPVALLSVETTDLIQTTPGGAATPAGNRTVGFAPVSIVSNAVFPSKAIDYGEQPGVRTTLGFWFDSDQDLGLEGSFFYLDKNSFDFGAVTGNSVNQFVINSGFNQNVFLVQTVMGQTQRTLQGTNPLIFVRQTTSSLVGSASNALYGTELNLRCTTLRYGCLTIGGLAGFRYLDFHEDLNINNNVRLFRPADFPVTAGDASGALSSDLSYSTTDTIRTYNHFYGGQVGVDMEFLWNRFFLDARGKIAVGAMHQVVNIDSRTLTINNDAARPNSPPSGVALGGLLTSPLDSGRHTRDRISFVPEANLKIGYQVTSWLRGYVGYDFISFSQVVRPGAQSGISTLNTNVTVANSTNQVNVNQPTFRFTDSNVWAQGLTFGLEMRY